MVSGSVDSTVLQEMQSLDVDIPDEGVVKLIIRKAGKNFGQGKPEPYSDTDGNRVYPTVKCEFTRGKYAGTAGTTYDDTQQLNDKINSMCSTLEELVCLIKSNTQRIKGGCT